MIAPGSSTACVAFGALTPWIASSLCWQGDKLSNDGLFVFLRRTEIELSRLGASPFSFEASPCKACSPPFMVDFIVFSSLFRVLFVLPVGLARLDDFPFSFHRLECSCHPSQSAKGDFLLGTRTAPELSVQVSATFLFRILESSLTCCPVFHSGGSFLSFLVDWSSFPTPPNRKM